MVDVRTEIIINKPLDIVAEYTADPDNAPEWYENIKSAEWLTPRFLEVGSKIAFAAYFLGNKLAYTYEVKLYVPNQKLIMQTAEGPFPMETTYAWYPVGEGKTRMILRNSGQLLGISKWLRPFIAAMMKRANKKDLKNLKEMLESV
ncbi:MAG: SRPBCC family protein [Cyclobacteriaceae bacterium]|nr:SRPBCC family protein [Cyclobacteriaceae bacterium]